MATRVGRGTIYLTSFNSPTPKLSDRCKNLGDILYMLSYSRFCVKFRCHGNRGRSW